MATTQTVQTPKAGTYRLDPAKSEITFEAKHLFGLGTVHGSFELESATIEVESKPELSRAKATIDAASYVSGSSLRDKQVKGKRFLSVESFPKITFVSDDLHCENSGWVLDGKLTVRGKTVPVSVEIHESTQRDDTLNLVATTRIDRYAFGIKASRGMAGRYLDMTLRLTARAD